MTEAQQKIDQLINRSLLEIRAIYVKTFKNLNDMSLDDSIIHHELDRMTRYISAFVQTNSFIEIIKMLNEYQTTLGDTP